MRNGYYWYRSKINIGAPEWGYSEWKICLIWNGIAHFFGQISQNLTNEYMVKWVQLGERIEDKK